MFKKHMLFLLKNISWEAVGNIEGDGEAGYFSKYRWKIFQKLKITLPSLKPSKQEYVIVH